MYSNKKLKKKLKNDLFKMQPLTWETTEFSKIIVGHLVKLILVVFMLIYIFQQMCKRVDA